MSEKDLHQPKTEMIYNPFCMHHRMKSTSKICTFDITRDCSLNHNVMSVKLNSKESENKSKVLIVSKL